MGYINRSIEDVLKRCEKSFKCILVTGARQTGKSTLFRKLFPNRRYVSFDDPFIEEQVKSNPNSFLMLNQLPIIYDEVQRVNLFRYIKIKCDETDERGQFCLLSPQLFGNKNNTIESLAGRVGIFELCNLSLREICGDSFDKPFLPTMEYVNERSKTVKKLQNIWQIIHRGGYPELHIQEVDWATFYARYVRTFLERDVRNHSAVHKLDDFFKFMVATAARTGQVLNYSSIADELGKDQTTIKNWLSILESFGIIYLLTPYSSLSLKRVIKAPKLYFRDTGLAAYLTRWLTPETLAVGTMSSAFFETFVISEILKSYSNSGIDYRYCISYYRGKDRVKVKKDGKEFETDSEIDLIVEENGTLYPIQVKQCADITADETAVFTVLNKIVNKKLGTGAVISLCSEPSNLGDNILQVPVWYI